MAEAAGIQDESTLPAMFRGVLTKAVGLKETVELETTKVDVQVDDVFMMCSDGLTKMLSDDDIANVIQKYAEGELDPLAHELINRAKQAGGDDNVSVVVVRADSFTDQITFPPNEIWEEEKPPPLPEEESAAKTDSIDTRRTGNSGLSTESSDEILDPALATPTSQPSDTSGSVKTPSGKGKRRLILAVGLIITGGFLSFFYLYPQRTSPPDDAITPQMIELKRERTPMGTGIEQIKIELHDIGLKTWRELTNAIQLSSGTYTIRFSQEKHQSITQSITLRSGSAPVELSVPKAHEWKPNELRRVMQLLTIQDPLEAQK